MRRLLSFIGLLALTGIGPSCSTIDLSHLGNGVIPPLEAGAAASLDAGADAGDAGSNPAGCPVGALCQDFDKSVKPEDGFGGISVRDATVTLSTTVFRSPFKSLSVEVPSPGGRGYGFVTDAWTSGLTELSAKFALRIVKRNPGSLFQVLYFQSIDAKETERRSNLKLMVSDDRIIVRESADTAADREVGTSPRSWSPTEWVEIRVAVDRSKKTASLFVDSVEVLANVGLIASWNEPSVLFGIGIDVPESTGTTGYELHFDDVVLEHR